MPDERVLSKRSERFTSVVVSAIVPEEFVSESSPRQQPPVSQPQTHAETDAQARFVQQNLRRIFLLIYRIVGNVDDAQDLTQETFIKALQRQGQLKDLDKASHWLSRIASNTAIDFLRRNKKFAFVDVSQVSETTSSTSDSPEQHVLRGERKLHLDGG